MKSRQYLACLFLQAALVANAPKKTWNLALNGIRLIQDAGKFYIAIGGEPAPYAVYTNEKWNKGANPNEGWIERTIEQSLPYIRQIMSGPITEKEINEALIEGHYKDIAQQRADWIAKKERQHDNI